ncbi:MAG: PHP-associated domain-containing protein [Fusobacteriota bacterium]
MPGNLILSRYVELGGKKITVGSDAHSADEVGHGFEYVHKLLEKFSELEVGIYKKHRFIK